MPEPLRGVQIELGFDATGAHVKRTLKFTNRALSTAQLHFDLRPVGDVIDRLDMYTVSELAACALLHEQPDASREWVESLLDQDPEAWWPTRNGVVNAWNESQRRMLPPERRKIYDDAAAKLGEANRPKNVSTAGVSADGPTSGSSSGSAEGTPSP